MIYATGLTVLSWSIGVATLLALGATGVGVWTTYAVFAIVSAGMFAVLASGDEKRMLAMFRWFRISVLVCFGLALLSAIVGLVLRLAAI